MKRSASSTFESASTGYRSATPSPTRQDDEVAGNADAIDRTAREENQHVLDTVPGHPEPMPFPGPYAHDPVPAIVARFGPADDVAVPAPVITSGVTDASTTATRQAARTAAPPGNAGPGATRTEHPETSPLSDGKDVNPDGLPPLLLAAKRGNLDQLRTLLKQPGVDIDQVDTRSGSTAMMFAAQAGNLDVVEFLLASGVDVNFKNQKNENTALIFAAEAGKLDVLNVLLKRPGVLLEQTNDDGWNALGRAAGRGHADIVKALLLAGADANFRHTIIGETALIIASHAGKLDVVNVLLAHPDILIDQTGDYGSSALACAAQAGHADIMKSLLLAGADVNARPPLSGTTALITACMLGKLESVKVLLEQPGILVDQTDNYGMTALAWASHQGHADIVGSLIDAGADMTFPDPNGESCLHRAITNGHANVVECLLARGAPLPNPLAMPPDESSHAICLSDLYLDHNMPAASTDNLLRLLDPHLLDDPNRFFQALVAALNPNAGGSVNEALAGWLAAQGIRQSILAPAMRSLGELSQVWRALAAPGQDSPTAQQKLAYCACTLSRLSLLAPDQQVAAPYLQASLSAAGVARLSQLAIAQRDRLVALAEVATAQLASDMLNRLAPDCLAKTGVGLRVDVDADALKTSMINAGFVAPLAQVLVNSWRAALEQLTATPVAMPQMLSMTEVMTFIHDRVATQDPKLFARSILRQLDSQALLTQWHATLGDINTEGLFSLFDDQCRQLREYCEQMRDHGE